MQRVSCHEMYLEWTTMRVDADSQRCLGVLSQEKYEAHKNDAIYALR